MKLDNLSIIILTYNEEIHIERCLREAKKLTDNIYIIDSYSTDATLKICTNYGCVIHQNTFINHAAQLNWAISNIEFTTDWIMRLDADEYCLPDLVEELSVKLNSLEKYITGIFFKRRVYFLGRWIRYGGYYPTILLRAWRNGTAVCENRWMDEHMILTEGQGAVFENDLVDDNKNNLHWWINKHNNYATREAIEQLKSKYRFLSNDIGSVHLLGTQGERKKFFKEKVYNVIPRGLRPFPYFFYRFVLRFGFLDGFRGFLFHILQGFWYRFLVDAKAYELEQKVETSGDSLQRVIRNEYGIEL